MHDRDVFPGAHVARIGDEIVACGQYFRLGGGTQVYLWSDPGGYDAYRVEKRFAPLEASDWDSISREIKTPNRFGLRRSNLSAAEVSAVRGGGWTLDVLRKVVDQFVIHCDTCGISQRCFEVLQDRRGLSVHFLIDLDGVIYQTLDLKERAWHATISNDRSIGVELANLGAYGEEEQDKFNSWYTHDHFSGKTKLRIPPELHGGGLKHKNFSGAPIRSNLVIDDLAGRRLRQYDYTPQQYNSLIRLSAALSVIFPQIKLDFPHDPQDASQCLRTKLPEREWAAYKGILGHYHIQAEKNDPGPAFQWNYVIGEAKKLLHGSPSSHILRTHPIPHNHAHHVTRLKPPVLPSNPVQSTQTEREMREARHTQTEKEPLFHKLMHQFAQQTDSLPSDIQSVGQQTDPEASHPPSSIFPVHHLPDFSVSPSLPLPLTPSMPVPPVSVFQEGPAPF
mmetsp:Transcript_23623/g.38831  ORF Transcript_23623/g.38831 Transcript_23623/m.38831 type:complete len:449 (+) Transcript_23623:3296-4642(+)